LREPDRCAFLVAALGIRVGHTPMGAGPAEAAHQPAFQRLVFHDRLAQHQALKQFGPLPGTEPDFLHRTSLCQAGELLPLGALRLPLPGCVGERQDVGSLPIDGPQGPAAEGARPHRQPAGSPCA